MHMRVQLPNNRPIGGSAPVGSSLDQVPEIDAVSIKQEEEDGDDDEEQQLIMTQDIVNPLTHNAELDSNEAASLRNLPYSTDGSDGRMSSVSYDTAQCPSSASSYYNSDVNGNSSANTSAIQMIRNRHTDQAMSIHLNDNMLVQQHHQILPQYLPNNANYGMLNYNNEDNGHDHDDEGQAHLRMDNVSETNIRLSIDTMLSVSINPSGSDVFNQLPTSSRPSRRIEYPSPTGTLNGEVCGVLEGKELKHSGEYVGTFKVNCVSAKFKGMFNGVHIECPQFSFNGKVSGGIFSGHFDGKIERGLNNEHNSFSGSFIGKLTGNFVGRRNMAVVSSGRPNILPRSGNSAFLVNQINEVDDDDDVQWIDPQQIDEMEKQSKSILAIQSSPSRSAFERYTHSRHTISGNVRSFDHTNESYDEEEERISYNRTSSTTSTQQSYYDQSDQSVNSNQPDNDQFDDTSSHNVLNSHATDDQECLNDDNFDCNHYNTDDNMSALSLSTELCAASDNESTNNGDRPQRRKSARIVDLEKKRSTLKRTQQQQLPAMKAPNVKRVTRMNKSKVTLELIDRRDKCNSRRVIKVECIEPGCNKSFDSFTQLTVHMSNLHKLGLYRCFAVGCTKRFINQRHLGIHHSENHSQTTTKFVCPTCEIEFADQAKASAHWNSHIKGTFECTLCTCFNNMINITSAQSHLNKSTRCRKTECGKICYDLHSMRNHLHSTLHSYPLTKLRYCKLNCGPLCYTFKKKSMIEHLRSVHSDRMSSGKIRNCLKKNMITMNKETFKMKIKEMAKQHKSKLSLMPSTSSATSDPFTNARPSTSGIAPMRPIGHMQELNYNEEDEDFYNSSSYYTQSPQFQKTKKCIIRDLSRN